MRHPKEDNRNVKESAVLTEETEATEKLKTHPGSEIRAIDLSSKKGQCLRQGRQTDSRSYKEVYRLMPVDWAISMSGTKPR